MAGQVCPFHADEWDSGTRSNDGTITYVCARNNGHPGGGGWSWVFMPAPPYHAGISGIAAELNLATDLADAVLALGHGWFEYGLVERSYAARRPVNFAHMVGLWGTPPLRKSDTRHQLISHTPSGN